MNDEMKRRDNDSKSIKGAVVFAFYRNSLFCLGYEKYLNMKSTYK